MSKTIEVPGSTTSRAAPRGLVVFDLDGTLLRNRTVCELLAEPLGQLTRMREMELLTSESDLADARREMARWYAGVPPADLMSHLQNAEFAPGASEAIGLLRQQGVECAISSITWLFAVKRFAERFEISHFQGTSISDAGRIEHVWPRDKGRWVRALASSLKVAPGRVATVGDSWRDLDMFKASAKAYFVGNAAEAEDLPAFVTRVSGGNLLSVAHDLLHAWPAE